MGTLSLTITGTNESGKGESDVTAIIICSSLVFS